MDRAVLKRDQAIIDEIIREAIFLHRSGDERGVWRTLDLAKNLRKKGLVHKKVKLRWAHIEWRIESEAREYEVQTPKEYAASATRWANLFDPPERAIKVA